MASSAPSVTGMVGDMARRVVVSALVLVSTLLVATPARAVIVCTYDGTTKKVTITLDNGDVARVAVQGAAITVGGSPCDAATVSNTDTIDVTSAGTAAALEIDLSGGAFAPGATAETDAADSEVEWLVSLLAGSTLRVVGASDRDNVVAGANGINLNAGETTGDVDVVITGAPTIVLDGQAGDDRLSNAGGAGTGDAGPIVTLNGADGSDVLVPGAAGTTVDGGDGPDTVDYSGVVAGVTVDLAQGKAERAGANDTLTAIENASGGGGNDTLIGDNDPNVLMGGGGDDAIDGGPGDDTMDGQAGSDTVEAGGGNAVVVDLGDGLMTGQGTDAITGFENVHGSAGNDKIAGNGQPNNLDGADGNDRIDGLAGPDELRGGKGKDTVSYGSATRRMAIDLTAGTATGAGEDTLVGFEDVDGSPKDDEITGGPGANVLDGRSGVDKITGQDGKDRVVGGNGADLLFGNGGNDLLLGDDGRDELDGGDGNDDVCKGGGDPDAFVHCENFQTSVPHNVWYFESR
jgi:Ca2+-binding RTX toxin-like protein